MKKSSLYTGAALFVVGLIFSSVSERVESKTTNQAVSGNVTILYTNDSHGRYLPFEAAPGNATAQTGEPGDTHHDFDRTGLVGGMAQLATAVDQIRRKRSPERVILVHAGDAFSDDLLGNLSRGEAMIQLMNAIGYQLMALGNHDFDYGVKRTRELQKIARFPMRAANVTVESTAETVLGDPTLVLDAGGLRVGFLALGYHNTNDTTDPENVKGLSFSSGIDAARRYLPELRKRSDIVVVLSHQGSKVDELLASQVDGIDLIIGGHSHDRMQKSGRPWIVQAMSDGAVLGEVNVMMEDGRIAKIENSEHVLWNDRYKPDERIDQMIEALRKPHLDELQKPIATASQRIGRQYKSESPFDKLTANLLREHANAEIAMLPGVGYGVSLQPGSITREHLYALIPHPSKIVKLNLKGTQILEILEQSATNQKPRDPMDNVGGLLQTSGIRWTIDLTKPVGQRIRDVSVGADPIVLDRTYSVVTNGGMLSGTHRYSTFTEGSDIQEEEKKVVDLVEERLRAMGQVHPPKTGEITLIKD
jgi:5'-nucleotidase / UDP-sugar diphosphatase